MFPFCCCFYFFLCILRGSKSGCVKEETLFWHLFLSLHTQFFLILRPPALNYLSRGYKMREKVFGGPRGGERRENALCVGECVCLFVRGWVGEGASAVSSASGHLLQQSLMDVIKKLGLFIPSQEQHIFHYCNATVCRKKTAWTCKCFKLLSARRLSDCPLKREGGKDHLFFVRCLQE